MVEIGFTERLASKPCTGHHTIRVRVSTQVLMLSSQLYKALGDRRSFLSGAEFRKIAFTLRSPWTRGVLDLDFVQIAISARLAHGDLVAADQALESDPSVLGVRLILVKQILLSCANVADLELISRGLYREHPEIGELITPYRRNFEFAKYIRNIAVGHVNPALSRKAIEWRPELNSVLATPKPGGDAFLGFAILETAINTFVDGDSHRIFEGDTDLGYPPDLTRFLSFLGNTAHVGMAYCEALAVAAVRRAELPEFDANLSDLAVRAGKTDFKFITRKGESG
jgi:hypothetical protein